MDSDEPKPAVPPDSPPTPDINSCVTEKFICMLSAFKCLDLQRILLAFDCSIVGEKSELLMRAIDLVSDPPKDFDYDDYLSIIGETYLMKFTLTPGTLSPQNSNILRCVHSKMYEVMDVIFEPFVLKAENTGLFFNELITTQVQMKLSYEQCNDIRINKDNDKNEYIYQVHIRANQIKLQLEKTDCLPRTCFILTNNNICPLPPQMLIQNETDNVGRRLLKPIDCTRFLTLNPNEENKITITWKPDETNYIVAIYLVKKQSINNLLMKLLKHRSQQSVRESKSDIVKRISNFKSDLERVSNRFSLVCPLSKTKIKIPVKSLYCDHLQCFDARMYISINNESPSWKCPICKKFCFYDDLRIDFYVLEIITKVNFITKSAKREILSDGSLKVYFAKTNELIIIVDDNPTENLINLMNLDKCYAPVNFQSKNEKNEENLSEDEVQVIETTQPESIINLEPQFEIQSESVSNSSNRGVEIEIDSNTRIIDVTSDDKNDEQDCQVQTMEVTQSESTFN